MLSDLTAILLCGGKGERLKPFTDTLPKTLVPLNGKPLLEHLLRYLSRAGVNRFVVCVGHKSEMIQQFLNDCKQPDWDVVCVDSGEASMTDRLIDARQHVWGSALICYGDTLANIDLSALKAAHQENRALVTMTVYPLHSPFGIVHLQESKRVEKFVEKPRLPYWINIGFMMCRPEAFEYLKPSSDMPDYLSSLAAAEELFAYQHEGKHLTINNEKERVAAELDVIEFFTLMDDNKI